MRRRAAFGLTIENSTARVWFCCRSSLVVSEFDFMVVREFFFLFHWALECISDMFRWNEIRSLKT